MVFWGAGQTGQAIVFSPPPITIHMWLVWVGAGWGGGGGGGGEGHIVQAVQAMVSFILPFLRYKSEQWVPFMSVCRCIYNVFLVRHCLGQVSFICLG